MRRGASWMLWTSCALAGPSAVAAPCVRVSVSDLVDEAAAQPASIVVLGERHGHAGDLNRAARVVAGLLAKDASARVTVALEAVAEGRGEVVSLWRAGNRADDLEALLDWSVSWGFDYAPYRPLLEASSDRVDVVEAGPPLSKRPEDAFFPVPPNYGEALQAMFGADAHPVTREFVAAMAWRDHRIASLSIEGWLGADGTPRGPLVVVTGRGHVEGGLGVAWQAQRLRPEARVIGATLGLGGAARCGDDDRYLR
jgi:uncharacterized iron-regulated protein